MLECIVQENNIGGEPLNQSSGPAVAVLVDQYREVWQAGCDQGGLVPGFFDSGQTLSAIAHQHSSSGASAIAPA